MESKDKLGIGMLMVMFISVIVGVILFQGAAQNIGQVTNTVQVANTTLTTIVNLTPQYLTNYKALNNVVIFNGTGVAIIDSSYYTVENNVVYNGALAVKITPNAPGNYTSAWKVSGTAQPLTYVSDSGSRSVVGLVLIFFALLIAFVALSPVKDKLSDLLGI